MTPLTAKLLDRTLLLVASVSMVARQYAFPSKSFWDPIWSGRPYIPIILIIVIGLFGAFTPFQSFVENRRKDSKAAIRQEILNHYGKLTAIALQVNPPIALQDLGLHVWRIRRSLRHPVHGFLQRVATYRLGTTPATRTFAPPKGTGVVGLCWKRNEEVSMDVEELADRLGDQEAFELHQATHGAESVMGLTWTDFQRVRHRGAVFASPIRGRGGTFLGCVSLDASKGHDSLDIPDVWHEINSLCSRLGHGALDDI
ncbi:hypothetical protein [Streptomyces virginiae]|uniref:hypothetical protein n=1 Tax=Streptomyces TaxID=1883 RepID=UPI00343FFF1A